MADPKIKIEMLPAGNGDAILLQFNEDIWLIDSGYIKQTYRECLLPRLKEYKKLDRLIITHIDSDHISGATALLKDNGAADDPQIIPIGQVWHNSYRHLQFKNKNTGKLSTEEQSKLIEHTFQDYVKEDIEKPEHPVSAGQGSTLARHLYLGKYNWNTDFKSKAVACDAPLRMKVGEDAWLTLLSPDKTALERLGKKWKKVLREKEYLDPLNEDQYFDDAMEYLLAGESSPGEGEDAVSTGSNWIDKIISQRAEYKEDNSVTNASSIAFLLEHAGKKILMLGDAIPSLVIKQLTKLCADRNHVLSAENPFKVDVLKIAHHGGFSNNSPDLFELIAADNYLISSNGLKHFHPHMKTLAWLIQSHPKHHKRILFNYCLNLNSLKFDNEHQELLKKIMDCKLWDKYNYEVVLPKKEGIHLLEL